ncbi:MAG: DUF3616 domain-containing protein [Verrucomicrobia subdivision 3 bacterium]|nr:DUF3616 domain-containing protein [Limisphaerales bacterium]
MTVVAPMLFLCAAFSAGRDLPSGAQTAHFIGCCDASATVAVTDDLFVMANDEDNILRVYSWKRLGAPVATSDLTAFLNPGRKSPEVDIEAAARIGDRIYWISSHGRNAKGKERLSRHRFFATTMAATNGAVRLKPAGNFYAGLLKDLDADPRFKPFSLARAAQWAPKIEGALNIEGLAATPQGHLLIGFRNPIPRGQALVVRLLNPGEVIFGRAPRFGDPILLDLGGLGVRSIEFCHHRGYVIVGGASDGRPGSRLFEWSGNGAPTPLLQRGWSFLNPEAVAVFGAAGSEQLLLLSDDGTLQIRGQDCKKLKDPDLKRFRAISVPLAYLEQDPVPGTALLE